MHLWSLTRYSTVKRYRTISRRIHLRWMAKLSWLITRRTPMLPCEYLCSWYFAVHGSSVLTSGCRVTWYKVLRRISYFHLSLYRVVEFILHIIYPCTGSCSLYSALFILVQGRGVYTPRYLSLYRVVEFASWLTRRLCWSKLMSDVHPIAPIDFFWIRTSDSLYANHMFYPLSPSRSLIAV